MKAKTRRKIEMGARALIFSRAHPDPSPGYIIKVAQLEECLTRAARLMGEQLTSKLEVRATASRKRTLLRMMRRTHLAHLRRVAQGAQREAPDLLRKFVLPRGTIPLLAFQSAARSMLAEAESWKDVMVRHGLSETLLQSLHQSLEHFNRAIERGIEAHRTHVGASAGLDEAGDDLVRIVGVMDPLNRFRFAEAPEVLAEWASLSHVVATPRPQEKDVSPAA